MRTTAISISLTTVLFSGVASAHDLAQGPRGISTREAAAVNDARLLNLTPEVRRSLFSIVRRDNIWSDKKITVCFGPQAALNTRQTLIEKIISIADEWTIGTKISFDWGPKPYRLCQSIQSANVRVDIASPANENEAIFQSLIGNEAISQNIDEFQPYSMTLLFPENSQYFNRDEVIRFYVLHEFGHALGFEHEHQRVDCNFDWDYVTRHFNFSSVQEAKDNMGKIFYSTIQAYPDNEAVIDGEFIVTKYDNYSVMKYNLSTRASPSGDDSKIYEAGEQSPCYRSGWVSQLTKFDRAGMTKAYSQPLVAILAIAQNLNDLSSTGTGDVMRHLSDPALGRTDIMAAVTAKLKSEAIPDKFMPDEELDIKRDFEMVRRSPDAIELLKKILAERHPN